MKRNDALPAIRAHADELTSMGVAHLYLFGSVALDAAHSASDVDMFIDFASPAFSLLDLTAVKALLATILGAPADLMTRASLHPRLRKTIEDTALQVF